MHITSQLKMMAFFNIYGPNGQGKKVLDIGSRSVRPRQYTYRASAENWGLDYTGLDFEEGRNVDIVPQDPYIWNELETASFDFVISGQAFEHNPFMWITFCEIARVLKPGGLACIIAPSAGPVHRYPYDCWRFYPDSWATLCALTGLSVVETIQDENLDQTIAGSEWLDAAVIARRPVFAQPDADAAFLARLAEITAPFRARRFEVQPATPNTGKWFAQYANRLKRWREKRDQNSAAE